MNDEIRQYLKDNLRLEIVQVALPRQCYSNRCGPSNQYTSFQIKLGDEVISEKTVHAFGMRIIDAKVVENVRRSSVEKPAS